MFHGVKGTPLTPREIEEYDRVFKEMDNLGKGSERIDRDMSPDSQSSAEQIPLFKDAG